ncbi:MAG: hypothetical protein IT441_05880 [Phycisphaeraceae bacterium]|nr:hypothetical protein [Phycisphaeraceae bacterium]
MLSFHTYFCPITGRGLESRDCVIRRWRPISPYADVPVLLSGWTFLAAGSIAFVVIGVDLSEFVLTFGTSLGITLSVLGAMRFVRQFRAYRHHRMEQIVEPPKATDTANAQPPEPS